MNSTSSLVYDPTDANSIAASSTIGSYVLAGDDGTAIGHVSDALKVNIASGSLSLGAEHNEDDAHVSGDAGLQMLAVRQDTLAASVSADGDYGSLKLDAVGSLYVKHSDDINIADGGNSITVDAVDLDIRSLDHTSGGANDSVRLGDGTDLITSTLEGGKQALDVYVANDIDVDDGIADTAIENTATAVSTTAVNVVSSALANRKYLALANEGNKTLYFGKTGVTTANGYPMRSRNQQIWRIGPSVTPQIIGGTGASSEDLRVMELS